MKNGFTMIEVITVLLLIGIVGAVLISRGTASETARLQAEVDTLKGHLRFAHSLAMNDLPTAQWGIDVGANSYRLVKYNNAVLEGTTPYSLPNEASDTHVFASGVSASAATVLFDQWGRPTVMAISVGGQIISIAAETGFIP